MMSRGFKLNCGHWGLAVGLTLAAGASVSRALTTDDFNGTFGAPNSAVWNTVLGGGTPANTVQVNGAGALVLTANTASDLNGATNYQAPFVWQKVLPGESWSIEAKYNGPAPGSTNANTWLQSAGIVGLAGTGTGVSSDAVQIVQYGWNIGTPTNVVTIGSPGAGYWNYIPPSDPIFLRLTDNGAGTLKASYSLDGTTFTAFGDYTQPNLYGIGLYGINYYAANPANGTTFAPQFDYFHVLTDVAPVPEPATLGVFGLGLAGLLLYRKRGGRHLAARPI